MLRPYCSCIVHTLPHVTARACRFHYARCHSVEARQWGMAPCAQRHTGGIMQDPEKMLEGEASSGMAAKGGTGAKQQLAGVLTVFSKRPDGPTEALQDTQDGPLRRQLSYPDAFYAQVCACAVR